MTRSPLGPAIALVSGAALALEVLLLRAFSIAQWHHFAYMVLSLALLGYGASGSFIALARPVLLARFGVAFAANACGFALTAVVGTAVALRLPFNALEVVWEPRQWLWLALGYAVLATPFFCASNCVCLALARPQAAVARLYAADLLGAGIGTVVVVGLLWLLPAGSCLLPIALPGLVAAVLVAIEEPPAERRAALAICIAGVVAVALAAWPDAASRIPANPYKALTQALNVTGARVLWRDSSPLGEITVVDSPVVPFRHVAGLSLANTVEPPPQLGVFVDGEGPLPITRYRPGATDLSYLDEVPAAVGYHLRPRPRVLVLGAGGGTEILQALHLEARRVDAVELNPQLLGLLTHRYARYSGYLAAQPQVHVHLAEARSFVDHSHAHWDLIQIPPLDAFGAAAAGVYALQEDYVYTVEAVQHYLDRLAPGGLLVLSRWVQVPPRAGAKLMATVVAALERRGSTDPGRQIAWLRSWNVQVLVVKDTPYTAGEIETIRSFSTQRWFDLAWLPGLAAAEVNRYTQLSEPYFFAAATALLGPDRADYLRRYKFDIEPATDDRPYFFRFLALRSLPEFVRMPAGRGWALMDIGYPVVIATLVQAVTASLVLVLLPVVVWRRLSPSTVTVGPGYARTAVYFGGLGFGFMFLEIAFMQRFGLYLGNPLYAMAIVLATFLVFAGIGSQRLGRDRGDAVAVRARLHPATMVVAVAVALTLALPQLYRGTALLPESVRVPLAIAALAPLAYCMGRPFPYGLARLGARAPALVPWAWAINGCASVIGAVLATLLAVHFGQTILIGIAASLYVVVALTRLDP
ncbi:MAG: SAM-dependent methyltransferase [Gammaproteobacteria bacterium]|nr:SAM-dependent methyltransferase [Gammaproteobacteria bacterium]